MPFPAVKDESFSAKTRMRQPCPRSALPFSRALEMQATAIRQEKEIQGAVAWIGKDVTDDMILRIENSKDFTKKLFKLSVVWI